MIYTTILFALLFTAYHIHTTRVVAKKDAQIQELNDRLSTRNLDEYARLKQVDKPVEPVEYEEPLSYWDVPRVRERREKV